MYCSQAKLLILFLTALVLSCCYSAKTFQKQPVEIEKNEVYLDSKLLKNTPVNFIITTPVNKKFLGIPFKKILYQSAHPKPKERFEKWLTKTEKRKQRIEKWLSAKQLKALENYTVKFNQWLKKNGESPAVLDSIEIDNSKKRIAQYYKNLGYFNIEVTHDTVSYKPGKVILNYNISPKAVFRIDSINTQISAPQIEEIYKAQQEGQTAEPTANAGSQDTGGNEASDVEDVDFEEVK